MTAFGKIGSYPHRVRSVTRWLAPQEALSALRRPRSLTRIMWAYTTTETRARPIMPSVFRAVHYERATSSPTASHRRGSRRAFRSSSLAGSNIRVTRWRTSPPPSPCPVSHVNLHREGRGRKRREIGTSDSGGEPVQSLCMNVESEGMLWIGVSASWPTLDPRRDAASEFLLHQRRCFSFASSSPSPSSLRQFSIFVIGAFRRFCSVFLPWPLSAIHGSSEVTFLIIIPTGRSLTRTQPSSCALVTYGLLVTNPRVIWFMTSRSKGLTADRTS